MGRDSHFDGTVRVSTDSPFVHPNERLDDLQLMGLKIIQKPDAFRFGTDTVLLADFAAPKKQDRVCDFGTGTGALCLLMAGHVSQCHFDALEIQADMADMAKRSVAFNGLTERITVHHADLRDAPKLLGPSSMSLVVCNPPYSPLGTALQSETEGKKLSRHEEAIDIHEIAASAAKLLRNGGRIAMVYPAPRLFELMTALKQRALEPKRVRLIMDKPNAVPKLALLDAVKGAGSMLHWQTPLILRDSSGDWSSEWKRIYRIEE